MKSHGFSSSFHGFPMVFLYGLHPSPVAPRLPPHFRDPGRAGQRRVEGDHVGLGVVKEGQGEGPLT